MKDNRKRFLIKKWVTKRERVEDKYQSFMHWIHDRFTYKELIE